MRSTHASTDGSKGGASDAGKKKSKDAGQLSPFSPQEPCRGAGRALLRSLRNYTNSEILKDCAKIEGAKIRFK